jgi:hypothetical protein
MTQIEKEVRAFTRQWIRKGGKDNRRQQYARMIAFAGHAAAAGAHSMAEVGRKQVIGYWKDHADLAPSTLYNHWRALCVLWQLAGMRGVPIKPRALTKSGVKTRSEPSTPPEAPPPHSPAP